MEQQVGKLCRKAALQIVSATNSKVKKFSPEPKELEPLLGPVRFTTEAAEKNLKPGVVIGLAWTMFGGEILFIFHQILRESNLHVQSAVHILQTGQYLYRLVLMLLWNKK